MSHCSFVRANSVGVCVSRDKKDVTVSINMNDDQRKAAIESMLYELGQDEAEQFIRSTYPAFFKGQQ